MEVKFAVSTWLWTSPFSTGSLGLLPKIKSMGFDGVEIAVEDASIIDTRQLTEALIDCDLQPIICGAFGPSRDLTSENEQLQQDCLDYIRECLDICNSVGSPFFAGPMYSAVGKARQLPDNQRMAEFQLAAHNLHKVCEMASERNLEIALEPLNRFETDLINTASDVRRLVETIDHPAARILLDSFHMTLEESNLREAVRTAGDRLAHVQVSENHRGVPGTGQTQWKKLARGLKDIDYKGFVSIESFTPDNQELAGAVCIWKKFAESQDQFATDGLSFLKKLFEF